MLVIRCKICGKQLEGHPSQLRSCQCPNLTSIRGGNISGKDLSIVEIITSPSRKKTKTVLTSEDLRFQEQRRQRKVRKLDFDER